MVSVPMALVDYIPVVLYCISAVILQRYFYERMSGGAFALLSAVNVKSYARVFKNAA
ncbi:MAG: hypothetical protein IJM27_03840 [Eubacterium sp.]|nr:hypothetical protein [Eubacterium sp.]